MTHCGDKTVRAKKLLADYTEACVQAATMKAAGKDTGRVYTSLCADRDLLAAHVILPAMIRGFDEV